ncbi:hypothetical protein [Terriglobus roseus]|uniref:Glycosyltransferase RgtA/B/C/D-like domain-containing protein n=1 Tax=Terriglobus roseus TaxID=392734 RepID=A0A1H4L2G2_9BACT|nr:hypothetical protein [Terriglobus roseus]SEB64515.1 hypothetical protein SAMN05443244_1434 [Terriglobus roseus]
MERQDQAVTEEFCTGVADVTSTRTRLLAWLGLLVPLASFWAMCVRFLSPLPVSDDYDAVLLFLARARESHTSWLSAVLFHQHNEYKPIWANALIALQYGLAGHVNFIVLSLLGDLQVMLLGWLLWKTFAPDTTTRMCRLILFVPVALLVFQTNYAETLNWPMPGIQNLGVVTFALLSLWLLNREGALNLVGACVGFALAIAASGNGLFLFPVGFWLLWHQRRRAHLFPWTFTLLACVAVYFTHYTRYSAGAGAPHAGIHPIFFLSFLGSFAGVKLPIIRYFSIPIGICVLGGMAFAAKRGFYRRNPAMAGLLVFLLITAIGVSTTRGGFGYAGSLSGRYKIYADLMLIGLYAFGLDMVAKQPARVRLRAYRWSLVMASLLFLFGTAFGFRAMKTRLTELNRGMALYRVTGGTEGPIPTQAPGKSAESIDPTAFNVHFREALQEAATSDVYHLP